MALMTEVGAALAANGRSPVTPLFAAEAAPTAGGAVKGRPFHGRDLRKGRYSQAGQIYLITTVTRNREKLFRFFPQRGDGVVGAASAANKGAIREHSFAAEAAPTMADLAFKNARVVVRALRHVEQRGMAQTLAYVLMPDHLHWLLTLDDANKLSTAVGRMKGATAREMNLLMSRQGQLVWQKGFHDHAIRGEEDIRDVARYMVANPLRAGLVKHVGDYPWWDAVWL